ncbi:hypothetical protein MKL09_23780 [Methylobacterium sp. J-048]|uniref:hypothetical protein n=1 Tax=Methylobacterium sp. J-048 TaxID=2836635 RepID=UPI001FB9E719|nr:hypothetical protein [Methylobacterium sp. J-048]MCJ2059548.1 hypothetical protein [Methylobacterium sp. J-048]
MSGADRLRTQTLRTLSEILGIPVEHFFDGDLPADGIGDPNECLRLWSRIRTREGRERALTCLRTIVEDERR